MFDDDTPENVAPIPIDELHSSFDTEDMWRYKHTRMDVPKENCGYYKTFTKDEHEHYTNWIKHIIIAQNIIPSIWKNMDHQRKQIKFWDRGGFLH